MIRTGPKSYEFLPGFRYELQAEVDFSVFHADEEGNPLSFLASSINRRLRIHVGEVVAAWVNVPEGVHWSLESVPVPLPHETPDPTPVEVPADVLEDTPLMEKIQRFIRSAVAHEYGSQSQEMETFEESVDFGPDDVDGEGDLLSPFQLSIPEAEPVEPIEKPNGNDTTGAVESSSTVEDPPPSPPPDAESPPGESKT